MLLASYRLISVLMITSLFWGGQGKPAQIGHLAYGNVAKVEKGWYTCQRNTHASLVSKKRLLSSEGRAGVG